MEQGRLTFRIAGRGREVVVGVGLDGVHAGLDRFQGEAADLIVQNSIGGRADDVAHGIGSVVKRLPFFVDERLGGGQNLRDGRWHNQSINKRRDRQMRGRKYLLRSFLDDRQMFFHFVERFAGQRVDGVDGTLQGLHHGQSVKGRKSDRVLGRREGPLDQFVRFLRQRRA